MTNNTTTAHRARSVLILAALSIGASALLVWVSALTQAGIDTNERRYAMRHLDRLIDPTLYTNDPVSDVIVVRDPDLLGGAAPRRAYRAFYDAVPVAVALETVAPGGYSGPIHLLVAISADARVTGVEVLSHRETRNLGDRIERDNTDWLLQFVGRDLTDPPLARWGVRRDGGQFDQFTGATVTPRAVVEAVRDTLIYFETHRDALFATTESSATP